MPDFKPTTCDFCQNPLLGGSDLDIVMNIGKVLHFLKKKKKLQIHRCICDSQFIMADLVLETTKQNNNHKSYYLWLTR
jgi:hypothetical protein